MLEYLKNNDEPILITNNRDAWRSLVFVVLTLCVITYFAVFRLEALISFYSHGFFPFFVSLIYLLIFFAMAKGIFMMSQIVLYNDRVVQKKKFNGPETFYLSDLTGWNDSYSIRFGTLSGLWLFFGDKKIHILATGNLGDIRDFLVEKGFQKEEPSIFHN